MAYNEDLDGQTVKWGAGKNFSTRFHNPFQVWEVTVNYDDLETGDGDGDSDTVPLTGFPTGVVIVGDDLEITEAWAGDGDGDGDDCAVKIGDTANDDEQVAAYTLMGESVGRGGHVAGTAFGTIRYEADWASAGAALTFTATDLADLASGGLKYRVFYFKPPLSTD